MIKAVALNIPAKQRPRVVFDMSFHWGERKLRRTVSGAALCLASSIVDAGIAQVSFMEKPLIENQSQSIEKKGTMFFAVSLFDHFFTKIQEEITAIKRSFPQSFILMGGPGVSKSRGIKSLSSCFPEVTVYVLGEGEKIMVKLVEILGERWADEPFDGETKEALSRMKGIYVKHFDFEHFNGETNILTDEELENQPMRYNFPSLAQDVVGTGFLNLFTSRGCRHRCIFCSHQIREKQAGWSAERIIEELHKIKELMKEGTLPPAAKQIAITDDDFFQNRERAVEFLGKVKESDIRQFFQFGLQGSVNSFFVNEDMDFELLNLLAGVELKLSLGTDGFHDETLKYLAKGYDMRKVRALVSELDERRIRQRHEAILTYRDITLEILLETTRNLIGLLNKYGGTFRFSPRLYLWIHDNTTLAQRMEKEGVKMNRVNPHEEDSIILPTTVYPKDERLDLLLWGLRRLINKGNLYLVISTALGVPQEKLNNAQWGPAKQRLSLLQKRLGRGAMIEDLLESENPPFQYVALKYFEKELLGVLDAN